MSYTTCVKMNYKTVQQRIYHGRLPNLTRSERYKYYDHQDQNTMAPVSNSRVIFDSYAGNLIEPGKTLVYDASSVIDVENAPLNGGFLLKTLILSLDVYMQPMMQQGVHSREVRLGPGLQGTHLTNTPSPSNLANRNCSLLADKEINKLTTTP